VINSIQQGIGAELDFQTIVDLVGDKLREVLGSPDLGIWWWDEDPAYCRRGYGHYEGKREPPGLRVRVADGLGPPTVQLLAEGKSYVTGTWEEQEAQGVTCLPGTPRSRSVAAVPIVGRQRVMGYVVVEDLHREHAFDESALRLLETVATSMGGAIENARLFAETERHARESSALSEVGRDLSSSLDLATVMDRIAGHARDLLGANNSAIFLPEPDGKTHRAIVAVGEATERASRARPPCRPASASSATCSKAAGPERINDTGADSRGVQIPGTDRRSDERLMVVPLLSGEVVQGAMAVWRNGGQPFEAHELEFLVGLSLQASVALQNARLFNETRDALEQQTAAAEVLNAISNSPTDVQPVFDKIVALALDLGKAASALVYRYEGGRLKVAAFIGERDVAALARTFPPEGLLPSRGFGAGRAVLERRAIGIEDLDLDSEYEPVFRMRTGRRLLSVPLLRDGEPIGTINVGWLTPGPIPAKLLMALQTFADQAVIAIENVRLFNETKAALERQTATAEVLQVVSSSMADAQPVFEKIVECCERLFPAQAFALGIVEEGDRVSLPVYRLTAAARAELGESEAAKVEADIKGAFPRPLAGTLTERAITSGRLVEIPQQTRDGADTAQPGVQAAARLGSAMVVAPLMWEGRGIGSLSMMRKDGDVCASATTRCCGPSPTRR
jgi:GAF domain-containing protein